MTVLHITCRRAEVTHNALTTVPSKTIFEFTLKQILHTKIMDNVASFTHCSYLATLGQSKRWILISKGLIQYESTPRLRIPEGGDGLQIWKVAANILNKQLETAGKGWYSSLDVGRRA